MEDSKGHPTNNLLLTLTRQQPGGVRGSGSGGAGAASSTRISCDAEELLDGWAAWTSALGNAARERERVVTQGIDSEDLSLSLQSSGVVATRGQCN